MRKLISIVVFTAVTLLSGCSSQAIYNDLQRNFQAQCYEKYIGSALQECIERYNTSYHTFKQRSEEVLGKDSDPSLTEFEKRRAEEAKDEAAGQKQGTI
ncbi:hypothetical protein NLG07_11185 [Alteromonas sp. LMIT006]|uniref:hypothetical protein n=1 Tax=Alteromonadaceae TaxID=72275 RepID=UPI0020CA781E|nr:hypothetical protein [Alteromonas sp. LMIT006]UTP72532.1 hypothetical protein NLG07_11185 [Alteromonas sp. LMIT006]